MWNNLSTAIICQRHSPAFSLESCKETEISHARGQILKFAWMSVCNFSFSEHVFSSPFLNSPNLILHPMHMSHSCVLRGIIYSSWQINSGKKCRFLSEWASCLSRSLSLLRQLIFSMQSSLIVQSAHSSSTFYLPAFISCDSHICDTFIVSFYFIPSVIFCLYWTWLKMRYVVLRCCLTQVQ